MTATCTCNRSHKLQKALKERQLQLWTLAWTILWKQGDPICLSWSQRTTLSLLSFRPLIINSHLVISMIKVQKTSQDMNSCLSNSTHKLYQLMSRLLGIWALNTGSQLTKQTTLIKLVQRLHSARFAQVATTCQRPRVKLRSLKEQGIWRTSMMYSRYTIILKSKSRGQLTSVIFFKAKDVVALLTGGSLTRKQIR